MYESRYADFIFSASGRHDLGSQGLVLPYVDLDVAYDTRSGVPGVAEVYNEDAVIPAFGLRAPLDADQYGELFLQGGYSFGLRSQPSFPETRYGFDYSREYGSSFGSVYPHAELNGNLTVYSRFAGNLIGTVDAYSDARLTTSLHTLVGAVVSFDNHREYANNYAEAYSGFLVPFSSELTLRVAGVEGAYLSRGVDVPERPFYSSVRVVLYHSAIP
jgi:hypothetical protein